ncbi:MAG: FkbM family methyltransferase [Candidatus Methanomethylicaceae archaeon]
MLIKKLVNLHRRNVLVFLFHRLPLKSREEILRSIYGRRNSYLITTIKFCSQEYALIIDPHDEGLSHELICYGIHEPKSSYTLLNYLRKNNFEVIIDVGSNIGYYPLLHFIGLHKRPTKLICIEPLKICYDVLLLNIKLHDIKADCLKIAIGPNDGHTHMLIYKRYNWSRIIDVASKSQSHNNSFRKLRKFITTESVKMYTISTIINSYFKGGDYKNLLIRADIEGAEFYIISDLFNNAKLKIRPFFMLEFHPLLMSKDKAIKAIDLLIRSRYTLDYIIERELDWPFTDAPIITNLELFDLKKEIVRLFNSESSKILRGSIFTLFLSPD